MIVYITGGAKNGKSALAQELTVRLSEDRKHYYFATMIPTDGEDHARIRKHVADRNGMGFETIECGRSVRSVLAKLEPESAVLFDSVTALLTNEMFRPENSYEADPDAGTRCIGDLCALADNVKDLILVSDYIFSDAERYDVVTELYRRSLADIDRALCERADTVLELCAGNIIIHKGGLPE